MSAEGGGYVKVEWVCPDRVGISRGRETGMSRGGRAGMSRGGISCHMTYLIDLLTRDAVLSKNPLILGPATVHQ